MACVEQVKEVKEPSIRARIYEGIEKGLFSRIAKGVYTVTKEQDGEEVTCMLVQGNGRDLSFLKDNSIDAIITDHAYDLKKSLKGGNRDLLWSSIFVTLMANKIGGLQFGIYRNCQISSRVFHTAVAALPLTKANRSDFE